MRVWFDTEFLENGETIKLISIGMVREDGAELYYETPEAIPLAAFGDNWLRENVLPSLIGVRCTRSRNYIVSAVQSFCEPAPEFWAYYADYDWVVLCQLFGRMIDLPEGWPMYCRDLKQALDEGGYGEPPKQNSGKHNALEDARWVRDTWLWVQRRGGTLLTP